LQSLGYPKAIKQISSEALNARSCPHDPIKVSGAMTLDDDEHKALERILGPRGGRPFAMKLSTPRCAVFGQLILMKTDLMLWGKDKRASEGAGID
jgi:hypothetical protein